MTTTDRRRSPQSPLYVTPNKPLHQLGESGPDLTSARATTTPMEHQLRHDIGNRTDIIRRRPDLTHMHLPNALDLIVTHLASLEQGIADLTDRLELLEAASLRQEGDGR